MNGLLFGLVNVVIVAIATGAPVTNEGSMGAAAASAQNAEDMIMVGKRAEEMVYFGNQQNEPRVPMKKSHSIDIHDILKPPTPPGELDQGGKIIVEEEIPVEEDLNDRAQATRGESDIERLAEGLKVAEETVEDAAKDASDMEDKAEEASSEEVVPETNVEDAVVVDLPESGGDSGDVLSNEENPVTDMEQEINSDKAGSEVEEVNDDDADEELASLSNEGNSSQEENEEASDENSTDADVEDFLDELRKESEESDTGGDDNEVLTNSLKGFKEMPENNNGVMDSNYYQSVYRMLENFYNGGPSDDYYKYRLYLGRRRRSPIRRRSFPASIRSRRNSHVRRIKRDLPSDWLAAYRGGLDIPYSDDMKDSLLSDPELSYEDEEEEPVSEELSRYIYANLLNKLYGGNIDTDVEEEIPLEDILPYDLSPEIPEPMLEEYEPEEILYEPENPYEEYVPSYEYRKRSGAGYFPDSRRKRYFYPAFEEPETHWGAIVPNKRSNYDDAIERLQRLAFALSDNPRPYYENLLREYKKK